MGTKEEALKLADELDGLISLEPVIIKACEDMIRKLVEELDKEKAKSGNSANSDFDTVHIKTALGRSLTQNEILNILQNSHSVALGMPIWNSAEEYRKLEKIINYAVNYTTPQTKPLSDEEIIDIWFAIPNGTLKARTIDFARAIEERHGIK